MDSPWHHIKLSNLKEYEDFVQLPHMKDLVNVRNKQHKTPLHLAIENKDILLTETLLKMDKTMYDIEDQEKKTAIRLLRDLCAENSEWVCFLS